ncbi:MAG: hypothetical protein QXF26_07905 [Candidatus Bathyarchaeia archaeon]
MGKMIPLGVLFVLLVMPSTLGESYAIRTVSKEVTFKWDETLTFSGLSLPFKVNIPATLSVYNLPYTAEPGAEIEIEASFTWREGATLGIGQDTFQIDEAVKREKVDIKEIDLSVVRPLVEQFLFNLIRVQLGMGEDQSRVFASTLAEYTQLTLINKVVVIVKILGPASQSPPEIEISIGNPAKARLTVGRLAKDGETVELTYECVWALALKLDLSKDVYDNTALAPLIGKLTRMIGLPFQNTLGEKKADGALTHSITIKTPFTITPQLILQVIFILAVVITVAIILILKFPRKPRWE